MLLGSVWLQIPGHSSLAQTILCVHGSSGRSVLLLLLVESADKDAAGCGGPDCVPEVREFARMTVLPNPFYLNLTGYPQPQVLPGWNLPQGAGVDCDYKLFYFLVKFVGFSLTCISQLAVG